MPQVKRETTTVVSSDKSSTQQKSSSKQPTEQQSKQEKNIGHKRKHSLTPSPINPVDSDVATTTTTVTTTVVVQPATPTQDELEDKKNAPDEGLSGTVIFLTLKVSLFLIFFIFLL